jgi:hypothetical protein
MWMRLVDFFAKHFLVLLSLFALAVYILTYATDRFGDPIRADGLGYYAYLPSTVIYHDPSFGVAAAKPLGGEFPAWSGIRPYGDSGTCLNRFTMGVALMALPFFLAAHVITLGVRAAGGSVVADGYSFLYQHGFGLAGVVYMVLGAAILRRILVRDVSARVALATLLALLFGTNLFHYGSGESMISHAYSFFLFAAWMHQIPRWYDASAGRWRSVLLGATLGLIALVRVTNVTVVVLLALYGIRSFDDIRVRAGLLKTRSRDLIAMAAGFGIVILPQLLWWHAATGHWLVSGYGVQGEGFHFLRPEVMNVLFSFKKGVFFWCPILMLAVAGLPALKFRQPEWFWPAATFMAINLYVIASWWNWWFGGGFGHRAFVESYAVLALPLSALFAAARSGAQRLTLALLSLLFVAWTQQLAILYYLRMIDYEGLDAQAVYDILWSIRDACH